MRNSSTEMRLHSTKFWHRIIDREHHKGILTKKGRVWGRRRIGTDRNMTINKHSSIRKMHSVKFQVTIAECGWGRVRARSIYKKLSLIKTQKTGLGLVRKKNTSMRHKLNSKKTLWSGPDWTLKVKLLWCKLLLSLAKLMASDSQEETAKIISISRMRCTAAIKKWECARATNRTSCPNLKIVKISQVRVSLPRASSTITPSTALRTE